MNNSSPIVLFYRCSGEQARDVGICGHSCENANSGDVDDIGYGGVDEKGTKAPTSRRYHDVWAEEEEELG